MCIIGGILYIYFQATLYIEPVTRYICEKCRQHSHNVCIIIIISKYAFAFRFGIRTRFFNLQIINFIFHCALRYHFQARCFENEGGYFSFLKMNLEFQICHHTLCISCYEKFMLQNDSGRRVTTYLGLSMEMTTCCIASCDKEIPTVCLKAMDMAIRGEKIAVRYLHLIWNYFSFLLVVSC